MDHWVSVLSFDTLYAKSLQSYLILCDSMDCSPPGSSVHGIHWARILEWVAIPFCRDSSQAGIEPGSPAFQVDSLPSEPAGKPTPKLPKNSLKLQCSQGKADKTFMWVHICLHKKQCSLLPLRKTPFSIFLDQSI